MTHRAWLSLVLFCCVGVVPMHATFEFGSPAAGFVVKSGTLTLGSQTLSDGSLIADGGWLACSSTVCNNVSLQDKSTHKSVCLDGVFTSSVALTLGNNNVFELRGGTFAEGFSVTGNEANPGVIRGSGHLTGDIFVADQSQLNIEWASPLFVGINLGPTTSGHRATAKLGADLHFAPGHFFSHAGDGDGRILFGCYRLLFGGNGGVETVIDSSLEWNAACCFLTGPAALDDGVALSMTSASYFNGSGSRLRFGTGASIDNSGNAVHLENIVLTDLGASSLMGPAAWTMENVRLEGGGAALTVDGSINSTAVNVFGGAVTFGPGIVKLESNLALHGTWTFGSASDAADEVMQLNLNGFTLDLAAVSAGLALQAVSGSCLRISNGRIVNLSGTKMSAPADSKIILENVELCLSVASSGNYTFADAALDIEGSCVVSGVAGNIFDNTSTAALTIKSNAILSIRDGMIYSHDNTGTTNFVMSESTSCLELVGGTFRRPASASTGRLLLTVGTLIIDHKSYLQPGTDGISFGDGAEPSHNLNIEIRPGATINVGSDGATTGTVALANV